MRVCSLCATLAFLLGVVGVLYLWPLLQDALQPSGSPNYNAGYAGYGGYDNGGSGGYGGNAGYGGYDGGPRYGTWGQSTYTVSAPYRPRPRIAPPPCYSPCY